MKNLAARLRFWAFFNGADIWTLLAYLLALALRAQIRPLAGVYLVTGGRLPQFLARHPLGAVRAMAMGRVVFAAERSDLRRHLRHEWAHVRQFARWGFLFPALYFLELLRQYIRGKKPYFDNVFECEARRNEVRRKVPGIKTGL